MSKENKGLTVLLIFTFFMVVGFEMIMPLIIGHYVNDLNFLATKVAFALSVRKFSQQGLAMVGGILADRNDIKKIISIGMLLRTLGFLSLGFADNFLVLLICMVLIGFGGVLFEAPYQTAIASLTTDENRKKYYSLNNTIVGIASTFGPLIGALMLRFDFGVVCFCAAFCFFINFLLCVIALPSIIRKNKTLSVKESLNIIKNDKRYIHYTLLMIVFWLSASQIDISFPLKVQEISGNPESVSWMYSIYAAVTAIVQYPLISFLSKRYSSIQIIVFGISSIALALFLVPMASATTEILVIVVIFTLGMLMSRPNQQSIAIEIAKDEAKGAYLGFNYLGFAFGSGFGTLIGGIFFDLSQKLGFYNLQWYLYFLVAIVATIGFYRFKRNIDTI